MKKIYFIILYILLFLPFASKAQTLACPPNIDFELGTYANWRYSIGTCCPIALPTPSAPAATRHTLTTATSGTDLYGGFPLLCPEGGGFSFKLGNNRGGSQAEGMRYYLKVPGGSKSYSVIFRYAVVLQNPNHPAEEQPRFEVLASDSATGDPVPCSQFSFVSSSVLPGFKQSTYDTLVYYKPWTMSSIDLSAMNGRTVALDFKTGDCTPGAHFGYAYIDINCALFQTYSMNCVGGKTTLTGPPGYNDYQWYDSAFTKTYGSGQNIQTNTPTVRTTFALVVKPYPGFGCPDTLYTTSIASDLYIKAYPEDSVICTQHGTQQIPLRGVGSTSMEGLSYTWAPSAGLSCTDCANPTASMNGPGTYYVTVTDSSKCTLTDTISLTVAPNVAGNLKAISDTVCQYQELNFYNNATNLPGVAHHWNVDTGTIRWQDTLGHMTASWNSPGVKTVVLHVTNGVCSIRDSVDIYVKPTPLPAFELKQNACINEVIELIPKVADDAYYYWTLTEQTIKDTTYQQKYKLTWANVGKKVITLNMAGKNGCVPPSYSDSVYIHENPETDIAIDTKEKICFGDRITVRVPEGEEYSYSWTPAVYFENNGYYQVMLRAEKAMTIAATVTNRWGCSYTDSTFINAGLCCKIFCPDAFTPNGDGHNDTYRPVNMEYHKLHTFTIMNRWGQVIFSTTDTRGKWDGTYKGVPQPMGTYYYMIKYICDDKDQLEQKGNFTLIR